MTPTHNSDRRVRRALRLLIARTPMLAALAFRLESTPDAKVRDMAADGKRLRWNPEWVASADIEIIEQAVAHLVLACGLTHHLRRGGRDEERWRLASHIATERIRHQLGYRGAFFIERDLSVEEAYGLLAREEEEQQERQQRRPGDILDAPGEGAGEGSGEGAGEQPPQSGPAPALTGEQRRREAQEWQVALLQAAQVDDAAKRAGNAPGSLAEAVRGALESRVDWRDLLREFITARARDDATWRRPNRRFVPHGYYLPSRDSEALGPVVFAVDTSGSMTGATERLLQQVWSEIRTVVEELRPESVRLLECDTRIRLDEDLTHDLPDELPIRGGGGTDLGPIMDAVRVDEDADHKRPACVIVFTDLYTSDFGSDPGVPVLWAVNNRQEWTGTPPFGRVIDVR